jgi:hypothetical protein
MYGIVTLSQKVSFKMTHFYGTLPPQVEKAKKKKPTFSTSDTTTTTTTYKKSLCSNIVYT